MNLKFKLITNEKNNSLLVNTLKISILILMTIALLGFFNPFYEYPNNAKIYGYQSMVIASGNYEYQNKWLYETGYWEFVPAALVKTQHDTGIPNILPLFPAIGAFFYKIFGLPGLFYLNPIITILFLIISERVATKYFGKYVGLLTLIFLSTNEMTFWVGSSLLTSMIFSGFFMMGIYFILKYVRSKSYTHILLMSIFFTLSAFIRPNGIIFVPVGLLTIISFLIIENYFRKNEFKKIQFTIKNTGKTIFYGISPWLVFVIFMLSFNQYYFGDPTTTFYNVPGLPQELLSEEDNAYEINFERFERYAGHFLPFPLDRLAASLNYGETSASNQFEEIIEIVKGIPYISHIGLSIFFVIGLALFFSFKNKMMRIELSVFSIFIFAFMIFYSLNYITIGRQGAARDMMPVFPLFYTMLGYVIVKILKKPITLNSKKSRVSIKFLKIIIISILVIFIPTSFYFADYSQIIKNEGMEIKNPILLTQKLPVIKDDISKDDIIVTVYEFDMVSRYGATVFTPYNPLDIDDPLHIQMISKLNTILEDEETNVLVFKNPHDVREKKFHIILNNHHEYVLKNYSDQFCKLELKNEQNITDKICIKIKN
jgi:hypothetical protein